MRLQYVRLALDVNAFRCIRSCFIEERALSSCPLATAAVKHEPRGDLEEPHAP